MNLVFLSPVGAIGGAERVLLHMVDAVGGFLHAARRTLITFGDGPLAEAAARRGVDVLVERLPASLAVVGDTSWPSLARAPLAAASAAAALARAAPDLYRYEAQLRRRLKSLRPSVVHSNGMKAHLLAKLATPRGTPRLLHWHDFLSERPLVRRMARFVSAGASAGIAVSRAVAEDVRRIVSKRPVEVVHNAVDTDHFCPGPADDAELDRSANLKPAPSGAIRVGLIGTYANWKGHDVFLQALARLPHVRGYIIGGPIYATAGSQVTRDQLQTIAINLGLIDRVGFVPFLPDPRDAYRSLDIVVHASTRPEPFGLTIAEAMSVGKPVVVAAAGGACELFTDGVEALAHRPGDAVDLAHQIDRLARDPDLQSRIGAAARASATARFSLSRFERDISRTVARVIGFGKHERTSEASNDKT